MPAAAELALRVQRTAGNQALQRMLPLQAAPSRQILRNGLAGLLAGTEGAHDVSEDILLQLPAREFFRQRQVSTQMRNRIDGILLTFVQAQDTVDALPTSFTRFATLRDLPMNRLVPVFRRIPGGLDGRTRVSLIEFVLLRPIDEWSLLVARTPIGALAIAEKLRLEDELACAARSRVDIGLIEYVFATLPTSQLTKLPQSDSDQTWPLLHSASVLLAGLGGMARWLPQLGLAVCQLPGFLMLLTDSRSVASDAQAREKLRTAPELPKFLGRSYDEIVGVLLALGFQRQEKYEEGRGDAGEAYGQDIWTHDTCLLVRIKVGGKSLKGRFSRPPHVVKEITRTPHAFSPQEVICKMTDDNILIPAGTKFSAKDMQSWYMKMAGVKLAADAWQKPAECGDLFFRDLVQLWAEGAHTAIGEVPKI